jgi:hypothetical protein
VSRQEKRQTKNFRKEAISKKERLEKGEKSKKLLLPIIVAGALLAFAFCVRRDALRCLAALGLFVRTESCKHCSSTTPVEGMYFNHQGIGRRVEAPSSRQPLPGA